MIQFDCHAHVYERVSAIPGARYSPTSPAPLSSWIKNLERHDLKGGVIVQVSFLGTDNSELCAALAKLDKARFAGVAVVTLGVDDRELDRLVTLGVRGIRWNMVRGTQVPDIEAPVVQDFFDKLRRKKLHLEVHLEGPRLAKHLDVLTDQGVNIIVDHFG
ncbi:MAG: amidohydrolase family protein, partial [Pseudomonadota bacterium]